MESESLKPLSTNPCVTFLPSSIMPVRITEKTKGLVSSNNIAEDNINTFITKRNLGFRVLREPNLDTRTNKVLVCYEFKENWFPK